MKKYIATYILNRKITETIELEARDDIQALELADFHKKTRGIKGKRTIELKK